MKEGTPTDHARSIFGEIIFDGFKTRWEYTVICNGHIICASQAKSYFEWKISTLVVQTNNPVHSAVRFGPIGFCVV